MTASDVEDGQAIYNPNLLRAYDLLVLRFSSRLLWRCRKEKTLAQYNRHLTAEHLDIGVGSGFHLANCRIPVARPKVTLVDLNANALAYTSQRLTRFDVTTHRTNALEPLGLPAASHGSASLSFLLHCLPGPMAVKTDALAHAAATVRPGGVVFGSTILARGVSTSRPARKLMATYNAKGIFHKDSLESLRTELRARFDSFDLRVEGCVALFEGRVG